MKRRVVYALLIVAGLVPAAYPAAANAQQAASTNYSVDEAFFGTGGQLCDPGVSGYSSNYCATSAAGETAVGSATSPGGSPNYQVQGGQNTYREEYIEVMLNNPACPASGSASLDLGVLSPSTAATAVSYFSVKSYMTSSGYVVRTAGAAPTVSSGASHTLTTMSGGSSSPGTEQFGINLKDNSTPNIGSEAVQLPDSTFGTGRAAANYNTADAFRYTDGDIIADSNGKSSGTTCYTISYLYNISNATPAGDYRFNQSLVATSTY